MMRWAEMVGAGILAAMSLATLAWAGPRRTGASYFSPLPAGGNDKDSGHANFAGKLPIRELNEERSVSKHLSQARHIVHIPVPCLRVETTSCQPSRLRLASA